MMRVCSSSCFLRSLSFLNHPLSIDVVPEGYSANVTISNDDDAFNVEDDWNDDLDGEGDPDTTWDTEEQEHDTISNESSVTLSTMSSKTSSKRGFDEAELDDAHLDTDRISPPSSPGMMITLPATSFVTDVVCRTKTCTRGLSLTSISCISITSLWPVDDVLALFSTSTRIGREHPILQRSYFMAF